MIKLHTCLRCSHQWPSKLEVPITCSKCRSPYWRIPKGTEVVKPVADFPVEIKKNSAASPITERSYSERAQLPLDDPDHPMNEQPWVPRVPTDYIRFKSTGEEPPKLHNRTDAERLAIIEELKPKADKENYKKESVIQPWNPKPVDDQPSFDELNTVDYGAI